MGTEIKALIHLLRLSMIWELIRLLVVLVVAVVVVVMADLECVLIALLSMKAVDPIVISVDYHSADSVTLRRDHIRIEIGSKSSQFYRRTSTSTCIHHDT